MLSWFDHVETMDDIRFPKQQIHVGIVNGCVKRVRPRWIFCNRIGDALEKV